MNINDILVKSKRVNKDVECNINLRLSIKLRDEFKGWCRDNDTTITAVLQEFMKECVSDSIQK